jgi:hypothetical protein
MQDPQDPLAGGPLSNPLRKGTRPATTLATIDPFQHYAAMHKNAAPAVRSPEISNNRLTLMEAIARKRAIAARYNGNLIKLAPHLLFERHGDLFVSALNMSKNWQKDDDRRLGQFKLAGLAGAELLDESFDPLPSYQASAPRTDDTLILAI